MNLLTFNLYLLITTTLLSVHITDIMAAEDELPVFSNIPVLQTMRMMAWERAKGELWSVSNTYWSAYDMDTAGNFEKYQALTKAFIEAVENEGLTE